MKEKHQGVEKLTTNLSRSFTRTERKQGWIMVAAAWAQARRDPNLLKQGLGWLLRCSRWKRGWRGSLGTLRCSVATITWNPGGFGIAISGSCLIPWRRRKGSADEWGPAVGGRKGGERERTLLGLSGLLLAGWAKTQVSFLPFLFLSFFLFYFPNHFKREFEFKSNQTKSISTKLNNDHHGCTNMFLSQWWNLISTKLICLLNYMLTKTF